mgnify:CR=1 FL=1|jgi:hypothetical protein
MKFSEIIMERTYAINGAVDLIYNKYIKADIDRLNKHLKGGRNPGYNLTPPEATMVTSAEIARLTNNRAIKAAHAVNPISVWFNNPSSLGNSYIPDYKWITLDVADQLFRLIHNYNIRSLKQVQALVPEKMARMLEKDLNGELIKQTLAHELAHWIDDSLNDSHITKHLDKKKQGSARETTRGKSIDADTIEVQAQIHSIKQAKRNVSAETWDNLTFDQLFSGEYPSLDVIRGMFADNPKMMRQWKRLLFKRMSREGLLGKNMR